MSELVRKAAWQAAVVTGKPLWFWKNIISWRVQYARRNAIDIAAFIGIDKEI